jgi:hypothetical protein
LLNLISKRAKGDSLIFHFGVPSSYPDLKHASLGVSPERTKNYYEAFVSRTDSVLEDSHVIPIWSKREFFVDDGYFFPYHSQQG